MAEPTKTTDRFRWKKLAPLLTRILFFGLLWWVLTEAYPGSWGFGLPVAILAALVSLAFRQPNGWGISVAGVLRFLPFFLWQSLRGGIDVAGRAFHPRLPLTPGLLELSLRLPPGPPQVFFADTLSLLPGTCSVEISPSGLLRIHALDTTMPLERDLRRVEARVAALFGVHLRTGEGGAGE
jgi:multicomponent Na+:H+ antiporter subunit E